MKQCQICGKGSIISDRRKKLRGNYNPTGRSRRFPNLQKTSVAGAKVVACTQCLRTLKKTK